jgi:hypothetical protein
MAYIGKAPISIFYGGTNQQNLPTNGQLLIGNNNTFTLGNLTAGSGINITNAAGSITVASTVSPPVLTPVFLARLSSTQSNVTGDGTDYTPIIFDALDGNVGSAYDNTTGLFTAPSTQIYVFSFGIQIVNIDPAHTLCSFKIETSAGTTAFGFYGNPYPINNAGYLMISQTAILALAANETVQVSLQISNGTKTIDVYGDNSGSYFTWFSGYLLAGNNGGSSTLDSVVDGSGNTVVPTGGLITLVNGNNVSSLSESASHITFNLTGTTQYQLQVGSAAGALASLSNGSAGQILVSNGAGANPSFQSVPTVVTWNAVAGTSQTLAVQKGYVNQNAGLTTFTLPATANFGDIVEIAGMGAGGWTIVQNTSQNIIVGNLTSTTTSGSVSSTAAHDTIRLLCTVANTTFMALDWAGNLTVV